MASRTSGKALDSAVEQRKTIRVRLTKTEVEKRKPAAIAYDVTDSEVPQLILRVTPFGHKAYYVRYRRPGTGKQSRYKLDDASDAFTPAEARAAAREVLTKVAKGEDPVDAKRSGREESRKALLNTLGGFVDNEYAPKYLSRCKSGDETLKRLKACFEADFWTMPLCEITPHLVDQWIEGRIAAGKANATINRDVTCLKGVLTKAVKWGFLDVHPLYKKLDTLPEDREKEPRYLTPDEEKKLMEALDARQDEQREARKRYNAFCETRKNEPLRDLSDLVYTDYLKPMVILSIHTGLRRNEVFSLRWNDVDLNIPRITVRGEVAKSQKTRYIPLNDTAVEVLRIWQAESPRSDLVFPSPQTGGKLTNVQSSWEQVLEKSGVQNFVWHNLRSTFASRLVQAGASIYAVKELLGHSSITTTERYMVLAPEQRIDAVARLVRPQNVVPFVPRDEMDSQSAESTPK